MLKLNISAHRYIRWDGYGRYALALIHALQQSGDFDLHVTNVEMHDLPAWAHPLAGLDHSRLTLSIMPSNMLANIPARQWNLSMYECERLPDGWSDHINTKAERLLVPCDWCARVFRDNGVTVPIHVVPGGVDVDECQLLPPVRKGARPYTFMALADRADRKGWDRVLSAFHDAFRPDDDVALVIKARRPEMLEQFPRAGVRDAMAQKVRLWIGEVPNVRDIYAQCDCYVFPTCAEGWGSPPREAAACGLPVIVTHYSGTAVGCEQWAYPLNDYVMATSPLPTPDHPGKWAKVRVQEIAHWMRYCYDHQDEARQKGQDAAAWLRANQTWTHSAAALKQLIEDIDVTQPAALQAQWAADEQLFQQDTQRLLARMAEVASAGD